MGCEFARKFYVCLWGLIHLLERIICLSDSARGSCMNTINRYHASNSLGKVRRRHLYHLPIQSNLHKQIFQGPENPHPLGPVHTPSLRTPPPHHQNQTKTHLPSTTAATIFLIFPTVASFPPHHTSSPSPSNTSPRARSADPTTSSPKPQARDGKP